MFKTFLRWLLAMNGISEVSTPVLTSLEMTALTPEERSFYFLFKGNGRGNYGEDNVN